MEKSKDVDGMVTFDFHDDHDELEKLVEKNLTLFVWQKYANLKNCISNK